MIEDDEALARAEIAMADMLAATLDCVARQMPEHDRAVIMVPRSQISLGHLIDNALAAHREHRRENPTC